MKAEGESRKAQTTQADPHDIEERTLEFAVRAVHLFRSLQSADDRAGWIVGKQFLRSATSVGANVAEARSAESRRDFVHKLQIAQKEAHESLYWLRLMAASGILPKPLVAALADEALQLVRILAAMSRNAKRNTPGDSVS